MAGSAATGPVGHKGLYALGIVAALGLAVLLLLSRPPATEVARDLEQSPASPLAGPSSQSPVAPSFGPASQSPLSPAAGPGAGLQSPVAPPRVQSPASPKGAPAGQTPGSPAGAPRGGHAPLKPKKPSQKPEFALARLHQIQEGMSHSEVTSLLGSPGVAVSRSGAETHIYRWSQDGASFLGRFDEGKLTRKTLLGTKKSTSAKGEEKGVLTQAQYDGLEEGMSIESIMAMLDVEAKLVSGARPGAEVMVYKWTDENGSNFMARFEDRKLVRKSGHFVSPIEEKDTKEKAAEEGTQEQNRVEEPAEAVVEGEALARRPAEERPPLPDEPLLPEGEPLPAQSDGERFEAEGESEPVAVPQRNPRIRVAGASRREREAAADPQSEAPRSYTPRAKLPAYSHSFRRGSFEVRVRNTTDSMVKVGLRSGKRGQDISVAPGRYKSFHVDAGAYSLYYVYKDDPKTLHHGRAVRIDGVFHTDVGITLFNEGVEEDGSETDGAGY